MSVEATSRTEKMSFDKKLVVMNPTVLMNAVDEFKAEIIVNEQPVQWLANAMEDAVDAASYRSFSLNEKLVKESGCNSFAELVVACFKVALGARLAQCGWMKAQFDKKNFEFISLFGPILAQYGQYHNSEEAYTIYPVADGTLTRDLKGFKCITDDGKFVIPSWYADAMRQFRKVHLMTAYGLPKDIKVDTPDCFKITVEDNQLVGRPGISVDDVFIAALVSSSKLSDLFGSYRTLYCGITAVRTAIENVGLKALHDLEMN